MNRFVTQSSNEKEQKMSELIGELKKAVINLSKAKIAYTRSKSKETAIEAITKCKDGIYSAAKNAKINLEDNSNKYEETRNEVNKILNEYELAIGTLKGAYEKTSRENTLKLTELYAKKDELLADFSILQDKRKEHIELNEEKLNEKLAPIEAEKAKYENDAIIAIQNGDYEKSRELLNKCDELKLNIYREEEKYSHMPNPYTENLKKNMKEYKECKKQIEEMEDLAEELEHNFKDSCEQSLENKEQALAKVENNKVFDKIKGFLSKSILKNINRAQKFQKNTLIPMKNNVKKFADSVPEKAEAMKEKSKSRFSEIMSKGKEMFKDAKEKVVEKARDTRDFVSDKVQDAKEGVSQAKDFTLGKVSQAKDFAMEKAENIYDFANAKIQDSKEGISQARDYLNGKTYQAIEAAYDFGVNTKAKGRESAINFLERKAKSMNEKAENMKEKNKELEEKYNKRNNEKALF